MKIEKIIKVHTELFKVIAAIGIVLAGGVYGLLMKLYQHPDNILHRVLFEGGFILLIFFVFAAIHKYLEIIKLLKKSKQNNDKNV